MFALSACGGGEEDDEAAESKSSSTAETPFGSVEEVTSYLAAIGPFVRQIGAIQADLEQRGVGSTGTAAAANIAPAAADAETSLKEILAGFEELTPPPLLSPFHRDTKKLILLRLEAYRAAIEGFDVQQTGSDEFDTYYADAKEKFR